MTNDYHDRRRGHLRSHIGQNRLPTTLIRSHIGQNTTTHDSDTIAMPGKYNHHDSDTIAMPGKARRDIFRVSRRCFPLYSARHRVAARQASPRPTACDASGYTPGTIFGHAPGVASGQPTVVIISPPEFLRPFGSKRAKLERGGVRGGLNRH